MSAMFMAYVLVIMFLPDWKMYTGVIGSDFIQVCPGREASLF